ncbi:hypothetical protein VOLCADRAFT_102815 [Volvox carteri f. nagariensis]|uniref:Uncharacterized protein n=1 Tax=Volvox carteri f. nagariensis TaxID=3068 RepID=D8TIB6_VOLCA|nr:uncharacterized protein VOLCADRAFT_102815 [Volvox carteri f. nagariensis]EFJ53212.1 hypothetical protein VOLCADRAFT_102815 [Volvox carteri f. nagariensis]|eukprot:XP_002946217.1 hypothetical protein VOLCADRAFT_102815 [Volvox carteri f. nagariensis]
MAAPALDLNQLKARLTRLGVDVRGGGAGSQGPHVTTVTAARSPEKQPEDARLVEPAAVDRGRKGMSDLFERINRVERAMSSAEAQGTAIKQALQEDLTALEALAAAGEPTRSPKRERVNVKKPKAGTKTRPSALAAGGGRGLSAAVRNADHMRSIPPTTPLSTVLAQFREAEAAWAHEKARLRRDAIEERKRANKLELEAKRQQRVLEHQALDIKALKTALKSRDSHIETATERVRELDNSLLRTQEETTLVIAELTAERDDLKGLLMAALQRLEAVNELVQRAEITSAVMEDKMRLLEEERSKALEAAARARTEVAELAESRRKLQWQSKLLEKMSEVQLKHNKRKSEAIRRLLSADEQSEMTVGLRSDLSALEADPAEE